jgi:hypothetical protein
MREVTDVREKYELADGVYDTHENEGALSGSSLHRSSAHRFPIWMSHLLP